MRTLDPRDPADEAILIQLDHHERRRKQIMAKDDGTPGTYELLAKGAHDPYFDGPWR